MACECFAIQVSTPIEKLLWEHWIPGLYLQAAAQKHPDPQKQSQITQLAQRRLAYLQRQDSPWLAYSPEQQRALQNLATDGANLFQRSFSCVEGRNAQLS